MVKTVGHSELERACQALDLDAARVLRVSEWGEQLYAQTRHLHGLTKTSRPILQAVAILQGPGSGEGGGAGARPFPSRALKTAFPHLDSSARALVADALHVQAAKPAGARRAGGHAMALAVRGKDRCGACRNGSAVCREIALRIAAIAQLANALDQSGTHETSLVGVVDDGEAVDLLVAGGPAATEDARAALEHAKLWNATMLRPVRSVRVHDGAAPQTALILPGHSIAEAGRRVLRRQLEQFMVRTYGLCYGNDIEYVHELRVALRRSRGALRVFREALDGARAEFQAELKWFAGVLGAVRDLDVFVAFLSAYKGRAPEPHLPFLRRLIRSVRSRRRYHYRKLLNVFGAARYSEFVNRFYPMLTAPPGGDGSFFPPIEGGQKPLARQAPRLLRRRLKKVKKYDRKLERLTPEAQHKLRIECKKLRYAAEFLADIYPGRLAAVIRPMVKMQDDLGDVHDADVYRARVQGFCARRRAAARQTKAERDAAAALLAHLDQQRDRSLKKAVAVWKAFTRKSALRRLAEMIQSPKKA